jgi:hypothetical protein
MLRIVVGQNFSFPSCSPKRGQREQRQPASAPLPHEKGTQLTASVESISQELSKYAD